MGEGSKGGQTGRISGLSERVLEDEREQEVSRRQPKRVFQARVGRRSTDVVVLERQRKHDGLPYEKGVSLEGDGRARSA